jgi:hypothetical protein
VFKFKVNIFEKVLTLSNFCGTIMMQEEWSSEDKEMGI